MFYTNVSQYGNNILFRGYKKTGERIQLKYPYAPSLYIPSKKDGKYKTLDGVLLDKISFSSIKESREFIEKYSDISNFPIYGFKNWKYTFISEKMGENINYDLTKIKVMVIDIETFLPKGGFDSFVEEANEAVTAITIRMNDDILVFGYKEDYTPKERNVKYIHCRDEYDMLGRFLEIYNSNHWNPDVISGWNVEFFDIPYLVNRISKTLGFEEAKRLSPWNILHTKKIYSFGRDQKTYTPVGVSILDYLQLYRKFTYHQQESYKLDHISHVELEEKKVDYSEHENLDALYENDYKKYLDYNIHDVNLVYRLDEKLKYFDLIFTMAYDAGINYADSLGTVLPWEVIIYNYLIRQNIVLPFKNPKDKDVPYTGAYVKEPLIGEHDWVVSFDATSLYPMTIIQYNIGPDTRIYKHDLEDRLNDPYVRLLYENMSEDGTKLRYFSVENVLTRRANEKIFEAVSKANLCVTANGCLYDRSRIGFFPALMKKFFAKRKEYKNKMIDFKKQKEKGKKVDNEIAKYHNAQMAMKIFLNSAYGAMGNKYFVFYDNDDAESVTLSGQLSIRWIENSVNGFLNDKLKTENKDYIIAMDTDSIYVKLGSIIDRYSGISDGTSTVLNNDDNVSSDDINNISIRFSDNDHRIADSLDRLSERVIQPKINETYQVLADMMNVYENTMDMKRENIANKAIWKAKKMYMMNVIDSEGVRYNEPDIKIMGIEAVKSSTPEVCKIALKNCYKIILNGTNEELIQYITQVESEFKQLPFADIAFPRGVNGMEKYKDHSTLYKKGTPIHVKGSLIYNKLIREHNISNLNPICDGDKIRFSYLKTPNIINDTVIASPGYLPKEFGLDKYLDYNTQFEKAFLDPLKSITDIIHWKTDNERSLSDFF